MVTLSEFCFLDKRYVDIVLFENVSELMNFGIDPVNVDLEYVKCVYGFY